MRRLLLVWGVLVSAAVVGRMAATMMAGESAAFGRRELAIAVLAPLAQTAVLGTVQAVRRRRAG